MTSPRTVAVAWLTSYAQLPPVSLWVFDALCWLSPDPIPDRLVTRPWPPAALAILPPEQRSEVARNPCRLLLPLYGFSLAARPIGPQRCLSIHRLVQEVGRIRQRRDGSVSARAARALGLVEADFVRPDTLENVDLHLLPERRATAPHVLAILGAPRRLRSGSSAGSGRSRSISRKLSKTSHGPGKSGRSW